MLDKLSIKNLSTAITAICSLLIIILFSVVYLKNDLDINLFHYIGGIVVSIIVLYFFILLLLEKYVDNKLRVIYKFLHNSKAKSSTNPIPAGVVSIDDVNKDVIKWASDTEKRIESLQTLAEYRKNFVGNVSHELKTPIFSLQGYLHTLLDGGIYDESINLKYINRAAENADRLQHIVEDLESIGKIESGKMELDVVEFDIYELIRGVFLDQKRMADKQKVKLKLGSDGDFPLIVKGDVEAIRQVLNNLVTNTLKYGDEGGTTIVSIFDLHDHILVEISDDGIGVEERHLEHLFDRFYRVDSSRSRLKGGSGLGLSIVKHLVEAHHQTINVRSTVGEGSTFGFTLKKA
ncbi:MAG: two-component system phosphate regulon sensor histidine kinase PhoR [Saprospiraceae bacterium]